MPSLNSWDSVSIVSLSRVNHALATSHSSLIEAFSFSGGDGSAFSTPYWCAGRFGPWRLNQGSSGDLLRLDLPITHGTISSRGGSVDISMTIAVMEISLEFLPDPTRSSLSNLVFAFKSAGKVGQKPQPDIVTPVTLIGEKGRLEPLGIPGRNDLLNGLAALLCSQASSLSHIFAQLNLVSHGAHAWLVPKHYAYRFETTGSAEGFLAILGKTTNYSVQNLRQGVAAQFFPNGDLDVSFAFRGDLFLEHLIMPALDSAFGSHAGRENFSFDSENHKIVCVRPFDLNSKKIALKTYRPRITSVDIHAISEGISVQAWGDCDMGAGIKMTFSTSSKYNIKLDTNSQFLFLEADGSTTVHHDVHIPWWVAIAPVGGLVGTIQSFIAKDFAKDIAKHFSGNIANKICPYIEWTGVSKIHVKTIQLEEAFVMKGKSV